jgi:hypothetical protein
MMHLVQQGKPVLALPPQSTAANPTSAYVNVRNYHMVYAVVTVAKGNAALTSFTLSQATNAAGAGPAAFANTAPIWVNLNATASDTLVRQANGLTYALDNANDGRGQVVIFQIDPDRLSDGFNSVAIVVAAGNADNIAGITFHGVEGRYQQATPPTMRA